jgi:hypothetical protein
MDVIIKFYTQARKSNMAARAAIRATTHEFIDLPHASATRPQVDWHSECARS